LIYQRVPGSTGSPLIVNYLLVIRYFPAELGLSVKPEIRLAQTGPVVVGITGDASTSLYYDPVSFISSPLLLSVSPSRNRSITRKISV
jgi:hypothetical protein